MKNACDILELIAVLASMFGILAGVVVLAALS